MKTYFLFAIIVLIALCEFQRLAFACQFEATKETFQTRIKEEKNPFTSSNRVVLPHAENDVVLPSSGREENRQESDSLPSNPLEGKCMLEVIL